MHPLQGWPEQVALSSLLVPEVEIAFLSMNWSSRNSPAGLRVLWPPGAYTSVVVHGSTQLRIRSRGAGCSTDVKKETVRAPESEQGEDAGGGWEQGR